MAGPQRHRAQPAHRPSRSLLEQPALSTVSSLAPPG